MLEDNNRHDGLMIVLNFLIDVANIKCFNYEMTIEIYG